MSSDYRSLRPAALVGEALGSLLAHPLRSLLTTLSVTFGASALFVLMSYASGVPETTANILRSMGSKEFIVEPQRSRGGGGGGSRNGRRIQVRYTDLPAIRQACPSIEALAPAYRPGRGGPVFALNKSWPWAALTGVGYDYRAVTDMRIAAGRWFTREEETTGKEVALISVPLAEGMFSGRDVLGEKIDAFGRRFEIIGTCESKASFAYSIFVPYPTAMEMGDTGGRFVSHIAFAPRDPKRASGAVAEIRNALSVLYSFDPDDPTAIDVKENMGFVARVEAISLGLEAMVFGIALLALVLGCLGAANVVGIAVSERTSELGLRKALGATPATIRAEVLTETLMLCTVGGALGVLVGLAATTALGPLEFSEQAQLLPQADAKLLATAFVVLVVTATLAGLPAAGRAARLDPARALTQE